VLQLPAKLRLEQAETDAPSRQQSLLASD
jgi:hypothetical protein